MFEVFGLVLELFAYTALDTDSSEKRHTRVLSTLVEVARQLEGSTYKPWFRKPRVLGKAGAFDLELLYLGRGRIDLTLRVSEDLDFALDAPGFFQRLFGDKEARASGALDAEQLGRARSLLHRYRGASLKANQGSLRLIATPGLEARAILALVQETAELAAGARPGGAWSPVEDLREPQEGVARGARLKA